MIERTLVIVKPDAFDRRLVGQVIQRFERADLELIQLRVSQGETDMIGAHYPTDDEWLSTVGGKTLADHADLGISPEARFGTVDAKQIGLEIRARLVDFLSNGRLVPMVWQGNRAIAAVRKLVGATLPVGAACGTIRGDFSTDSTDLAASESRPVRNLVHASGDAEEAHREIALWFPNLNS